MSNEKKAKAQAGINIALIKYWGKKNTELNQPAVGSLSLTLDTFTTETTVHFSDACAKDTFTLNGSTRDDNRVSSLLHDIRRIAAVRECATVTSVNRVPTASGLASSASGTAALVTAAWHAAGLPTENLVHNPTFLDLVRRGSGSAPRSLLPGLVELERDSGQITSLWSGSDWPIRMVVAQATQGPKEISSREGMAITQASSPYYKAWVEQHPRHLRAARDAIAGRDIEALGHLMEVSTMRMHACMLASDPPLRYLKGVTLQMMDCIESLRRGGLGAWYTMDAGPHVKVLCLEDDVSAVVDALSELIDHDRISVAKPGPGAHCIEP
ncbi:MAG: diphosphomevalonate decarboxylase [Myxococcales bacterium]|nr:diphosphomevalonate decarboxylase [Myxococcales bacterium]